MYFQIVFSIIGLQYCKFQRTMWKDVSTIKVFGASLFSYISLRIGPFLFTKQTRDQMQTINEYKYENI